MVVAGLALLLRQLRYSHDSALFTLCFLIGDLSYALVGHVALAYPSGRTVDRAGKALARAGYVTTLGFSLVVLLLYDGRGQLFQFDPFPRKSLLTVSSQPHAVELVQKTFVVLFYGLLATLLIAYLL